MRGAAAWAGALVGAVTLAAAVAAGPVRAGGPQGAPKPTPGAGAAADLRTQAGQAAAEGARFGRQHTASPVLFPDQSLPIRFSHAEHLNKKGVVCKDCHGTQVMSGPGVLASVRSEDVNLPSEAVCFNCHDVEVPEEARPAARCSTCHAGYDPPLPAGFEAAQTKTFAVRPPALRLPPPHVKMNHKRHLELGIGCESCHGDMRKIALATRENALPVMGTCLTCHRGGPQEYRVAVGEPAAPGVTRTVSIQAPQACRTCHETEGDGRVRTRYETGTLAPAGWYEQDPHGDGWDKGHRMAGQLADGYCASCHAPSFCTDCHNGVSKPLKLHPNNWVLSHPIAARKNDPDCASCHRAQTFCLDCHMTTRVGGDKRAKPAATADGLRFHPAGWDDATRGPNHHAIEAQRNLRACTSCHTEATCVECHGSAGLGKTGINPHPPGFAMNDCRRMRDRNVRVCNKCHTPGDSSLECR